MINPQELYDTIDNYVQDEMSETERIDFEKRIAQDETLAAKVEEVRNANEAIYFGSLAELKLTIGKDIKKIKYEPGFNWKNAAYLSVGSLLMISGIIAYLMNDHENPETKRTESEYVITNPLQEKNNPDKEELKGSSEKSPLTSISNNKTHDSITSGSKSSVESNSSYIPVQKDLEEPRNINPENKVLPIVKDDRVKEKEPASMSETKPSCDKSFKITSEASCKHQETGSIIILTDNSNDYIFHVNNHITSGSKGVFHNLASGTYEVSVGYGKECSYNKSVTIGEKWCPMNSPYSFNPDYNEKWVLKYEQGTSGRFTIFDTRGKEIYSSAFGSGNEQWNGTDIYGSTVQMGVYIGIIHYSNGLEERVELTIVR